MGRSFKPPPCLRPGSRCVMKEHGSRGGALESRPPKTRIRGVGLKGYVVYLERDGVLLRSSDGITWEPLNLEHGWHRAK